MSDVIGSGRLCSQSATRSRLFPQRGRSVLCLCACEMRIATPLKSSIYEGSTAIQTKAGCLEVSASAAKNIFDKALAVPQVAKLEDCY